MIQWFWKLIDKLPPMYQYYELKLWMRVIEHPILLAGRPYRIIEATGENMLYKKLPEERW